MRFIKIFTVINIVFASIFGLYYFSSENSTHKSGGLSKLLHPHAMERGDVSKLLSTFVNKNEYPGELVTEINGEKKQIHINYTFDEKLQSFAKGIFDQYKPDYGAVVALDAKSGRILSLHSFSKSPNELGNLSLRASFPSASIFKVITAAAIIDRNIASPDSRVPFNGSSHTLFKRNVFHDSKNRWSRQMTIREAFAKSVNTVFAKLGSRYIEPQVLQEYASRFRFNQEIKADLPVQYGSTIIPSNDDWAVAEAASGYTLDNKMSPLQGAMIAATIANDGKMMDPFAVESITSNDGGVVYSVEPVEPTLVLSENTADEMRVLMRETIKSGTSSRMFRRLVKNKHFKDIEMGGKTGSLTGTDPKGKCDWFVGYARGRNQNIALGVLIVNKERWYVRSSFVAQAMFQKYFSE